MTTANIVSYNLDHDDSGASGWSYREVLSIPTSQFTKLTLTFKASVAGWQTSHVGIAVVSSGYTTKQAPIEVMFGGASGFNIGSNAEITSGTIDLTAAGITLQVGDSLMVTNCTVSGAPKNNTEFGTIEYCRGSDSTSWNQASPSGTFLSNLAYIGGVKTVTALDLSAGPTPVWVGGRSVKMYPSNTPGAYVYEKPDGSALDVSADPTGGVQAVLDFGRNNNAAVEIVGNGALPYNTGAGIDFGILQGHDIEIKNFWLEPQVPLSGNLVTIRGMDRTARIAWQSGKVRLHAADANALAVAFIPAGYRVLYPNGTFDGSPNYPGRVTMPTAEAIWLPGYAKPSVNGLVAALMDQTNGVANGWTVDFGNIDGAGLVANPLRVTDCPHGSFAYDRFSFGRLSGFTDIGLLVGDTAAGRGFVSGTSWFGYLETGSSYGGPLRAGIMTSATFDNYSGIQAINCYGGGLQAGIHFTSGASNCYLGKSANGRYPMQFYGCTTNIIDDNGNNDH